MSFEVYKLPEGKIMIAHSDKSMSIGILELNPQQALSKHNRPALESLFQIKGSCTIKLFNKDLGIEEVVLNEGDSIDITSGQFHIHSNPNDEPSVTLWKASGDITDVIDNIKKNSEIR